MSPEQREKLRQAQLAYCAHDPRWAAHRAKLAAAQRNPEQRATLSAKQLAYMANDPRWPEHRERMMAATPAAAKFMLLPEEVEQVVKLRAKGRNFEYVAETLCLSEKVIRRELRQLGIDTKPVRSKRKIKRGKGHWKSFEPVEVASLRIG